MEAKFKIAFIYQKMCLQYSILQLIQSNRQEILIDRENSLFKFSGQFIGNPVQQNASSCLRWFKVSEIGSF